MTKKALIVAAHPDDEVLGCGGTVARMTGEGVAVHVAFLADGVFSRVGEETQQLAELKARRKAATAACEILGVDSLSFSDFPDNRMDTVAMLDVARAIEALVEEHNPDTIFTHHGGDVNVDHTVLHRAVVTACRPQTAHPVKTILAFEIASNTEWQVGGRDAFVPNWYVDVSATLERKLAALKQYSAELRDWPHPRSLRAVEHLARWRGATVGVEAAEAFVLARHIR